MLFILTTSTDATADYLAKFLIEHDVPILRFDTDRGLSDAAVRYEIELPRLYLLDRWYAPSDFSNVWYRRPEQLAHSKINDSPEGLLSLNEWAGALEGFFAHIPINKWMNHPAANVSASYKLEQLTTAHRIGFQVPKTLVTQRPEHLRAFFHKCNGALIVKPLSVGRVIRPDSGEQSLIYTSLVFEEHLAELEDLQICPTLFQEYIKKISDIRITVVDRDIHAVELKACEPDGSQRCDIRRDNMSDVEYRCVDVPTRIEERIRLLMSHYKLRFAAIDFAVTSEGDWVFFEINPNGQWAWLDLAGASMIADSFRCSFSNNGTGKGA